MNAKRSALGALAAIAAAAMLAACGGGGAPAVQGAPGQGASQPPTPLPSVSPPSHMYVEYGTASGHALVEYRLPLSAHSVPDAILHQDAFINANPYAVDIVHGTLAIAPSVDNMPDGLRVYPAPLSAGQAPSVVIPSGPATLPFGSTATTFDPLGNLWLSTLADIREFALPFANYEVASTIQSNYTFANLQVDPGGSLYGIGNPLNIFPPLDPPVTFAYTRPPKKIGGMVQFFTPFAFDPFGNGIAGYHVVATGPTPLPSPFPVPTAGLGIFPLPITADELPSVVLPLPGSGQANPAADGSIGTDQSNLYVGDSQDGSIYVYSFPISSAQPAFRVPCPAVFAPCTLPAQNLPNAVFQYGP